MSSKPKFPEESVIKGVPSYLNTLILSSIIQRKIIDDREKYPFIIDFVRTRQAYITVSRSAKHDYEAGYESGNHVYVVAVRYTVAQFQFLTINVEDDISELHKKLNKLLGLLEDQIKRFKEWV